MTKNRNFWWIYKRTGLVLFILFLLSNIFLSSKTATYGLNKTVGWAWEFSNIYFWLGLIGFISIILFVIALISFIIKVLFFK